MDKQACKLRRMAPSVPNVMAASCGSERELPA